MTLFDQFLAAIADAEAGIADDDPAMAEAGLDQVRALLDAHPDLAAALGPALHQAEAQVATWFGDA